ncbi:M48 family metalloprotease [Aquirhabdus sp.]|uniref:M48 family metalloprotease n=1 Tax=Aquirhabdus sp. TaxID=2824160 RepID=UPI00396C8204
MLMRCNLILWTLGISAICPMLTHAKIESDVWDTQVHSSSESYVLPTLGSQPGLIDQARDKTIGEAVLREINKEVPVVDDPLVQDDLERMYRRIYAQTLLGTPTALLLIQDEEINAFAVPGGLVAMNTGLLLSADNADEVAGVLSHEIAHVSQRHYSRQTDAMKNQKWWALGGAIAAIALAKKDGDTSSALFMGTQASLMSQQLAYSRDNEREADRVGMQLMQSAGYDPRAMPDFFEIMQKKTRMVGFVPSFILTHPLTSERISEARLRANQYSLDQVRPASSMMNQSSSLLSSPQLDAFHVMQLRVAAVTNTTNISALIPQAKTDDAAALALAYLYQKAGRIIDARKLVTPLLTRYPDSAYVTITAAEIEIADNKSATAIKLLEPLSRVMPESRPIIMTLARAYVLLGQGQTAIDLLRPWTLKRPQDIQLWQLMKEAAEKLPATNKNAISVLRYRAEMLFWQGSIESALRSLDRAEALADKKSVEFELITLRTKYMEQKMKEKLKDL